MAEGHRERLRQRFSNEEVDDLPEYIVLEMMLQGSIARKDTNKLARRLLDAFGGIAQVIDAPLEELLRIEGMGKAAAAHLKLIPQFYRRYRLSKWDNSMIFSDPTLAGDYLLDKFTGHTNEIVIALCMDSNCRVLCCKKVCEGSINAVHVSIRKIVEIALKYNASRVIIAHNHMSGNALPSSDDLATTKKVQQALDYVGVMLDDHIIAADDDYISLSQSGYFKKF